MHRKYNCHLELPFFKQKIHSTESLVLSLKETLYQTPFSLSVTPTPSNNCMLSFWQADFVGQAQDFLMMTELRSQENIFPYFLLGYPLQQKTSNAEVSAWYQNYTRSWNEDFRGHKLKLFGSINSTKSSSKSSKWCMTALFSPTVYCFPGCWNVWWVLCTYHLKPFLNLAPCPLIGKHNS